MASFLNDAASRAEVRIRGTRRFWMRRGGLFEDYTIRD
jgi:hypothetical protein